MTTYTDLTLTGVAISSTTGSIVGALMLYYLGYRIDPSKSASLIGKYGRWMRLDIEDYNKALSWFTSHSGRAVLICRFIPIVRCLISIPAGNSRMNLGWFLLYTTIGAFIWNMVFIYIGSVTGASWDTIDKYLDTFSTIAVVLLVIASIWIAVRIIRKRKKHNKS